MRAAALYGLITRAAQSGDYQASLAAAEEALALAKTTDDPFALGRAYFGVGIALEYIGDFEGIAAALAHAVPYLRQTDRLDFLGLALSNLGDALHFTGDLSAAQRFLDEALSVCEHADDRWGHAVALSQRGHLACTQGDFPLAVRLYAHAIAEAQSLGEERQIMFNVAWLANVALASGQPERAARLLGAIAAAQDPTGYTVRHRHFARIEPSTRAVLGDSAFMAAWDVGRGIAWSEAVADALAVLDLDRTAPLGPPPPRSSDLFNLTRREREVLTLLCQRLTDSEIATALFISPRTASGHVANVLGKLGVSSRRDVAAYAARHGLV